MMAYFDQFCHELSYGGGRASSSETALVHTPVNANEANLPDLEQ